MLVLSYLHELSYLHALSYLHVSVSPRLDFLKSLEAEMKSLTHSPKKSKPSQVGHGAAPRPSSNVGSRAALLTPRCDNVVSSPQVDIVSKVKQTDPSSVQSSAGKSKAGKAVTVSSNSTTNVDKHNTSHRKTVVSDSGINFHDKVGQAKEFHLSQSRYLKVSIHNDTRPPEGGTGTGTIGNEALENTDLAGEIGTGDTRVCETHGHESMLHEAVAMSEPPKVPAPSCVEGTGDTCQPPLTQQSTDAVRQKAVSFLKDITTQLFTPALAAKGLDPFNRVLFEGDTVHVGSTIDDIAVTFTHNPDDLAGDLCGKLEANEMLERSLFEAMHR